MAGPGTRSTNIPLGRLVEVIGHEDTGGGTLSIRRMRIGDLVNVMLGLATGDASVVAGFAAQLAEETSNRGIVDEQLSRRIDREVIALAAADAEATTAIAGEQQERACALAAEADARTGCRSTLGRRDR